MAAYSCAANSLTDNYLAVWKKCDGHHVSCLPNGLTVAEYSSYCEIIGIIDVA
jgi:hypothetical protein